MSYFKELSPESQGIDSEGILQFLEYIDHKGLELHRFMMIRHGICVAKAAYSPYKLDDLHPVYSFTKSFTSTAIGFAVQEGILSLDEHIVDYFPEEIPDAKDLLLPDGSTPKASYPSANAAKSVEEMIANLKEITLHHLLCMSCGQEEESRDRGEQWITKFFHQPVIYKPGTFYKYNTMGTNILAAILKKKTGQDITEFLKDRLFKPLNMGDIFCYHLPDSMQVQSAGSGMKLSIENMAKFTYFMLHNGHWEGKVVLPDWYPLMSKKHMETEGDSEGHIKDWAMGYGYQCWMGMVEGSFRADGAYGQFGLVFPKQDLIVIINAATEQTQSILDAVNEFLIPAVDFSLSKNKSKENEEALQALLNDRLKNLHLPALKNCHNPTFEKKLEGRIYHTKQSCSSLKTWIGGAGLSEAADQDGILKMRFSIKDDMLHWFVEENNNSYEMKACLANSFYRGYSAATKSEYAATARWRSLHCLEMEVRRMDAMSGTRFLFRFEGENQEFLRIETDETMMSDGGYGMTDRIVPDFELE
ncbi:MAG: serine hydrolase domain-containing protein [Eubacteriales bacterium]|nr:serine hydrolase domain-containing protein [Eubacteriales bacterium]